MIELLRLILHIMASLFKPRTKLVAEILILRQHRASQVSRRPQLSNTIDFCLFGSIVGSLPSSARLQFSAQRRSSAGIARGFSLTGAGASRAPLGKPLTRAQDHFVRLSDRQALRSFPTSWE